MLGCLAALLLGCCLATLLLGCFAAWLLGCLAAWLAAWPPSCYFAAWLLNCLATLLLGCSAAWLHAGCCWAALLPACMLRGSVLEITLGLVLGVAANNRHQPANSQYQAYQPATANNQPPITNQSNYAIAGIPPPRLKPRSSSQAAPEAAAAPSTLQAIPVSSVGGSKIRGPPNSILACAREARSPAIA